MSSKILIVDDDVDICEILEFNLANEGFDVSTSHSAEAALECLDDSVDLILLDVMMFGMSGYKMAEKLKKEGRIFPIIFLTAKNSENEMLTGFSVGADDYIAKPFSIKEVIARIKAVLKRSNKPKSETKEEQSLGLCFNGLRIDTETKELYIEEQLVSLTRTEYNILLLLAQYQEKIFSRDDIIDRVWKDTPYVTERTVDVHITRLRKKLGDYAHCIINRSGYGYKFDLGENNHK